MVAPQRLRADAARNRANILRATRSLFAAHGEAVGIDEIAREAGVAVGTLYRHFPTKADLVGAVAAELADRVFAALGEAAGRVEERGSALRELAVLTERISTTAGEDRAVKVAMRGLGVQAPREARDKALSDLAHIVAAGHREGSLHPDVTVADLVLVMETLPGDELPEPARRRWVRLMLRGLSSGAATPDAETATETAAEAEAARPGDRAAV
jgi:AcrR family transcriptional regulator